MTSLVTPPLVADVVARDRRADRAQAPDGPGGYDRVALRDRAAVGHAPATASEVPVSIVHRRDLLDVAGAGELRRDRPTPMLLYGYGAYEI